MRFDIQLGKTFSHTPRIPIGEIISVVNTRIQRPRYAPSVIIGSMVLVGSLSTLMPLLVVPFFVLAGLGFSGFLFLKERRDRVTQLTYELDPEVQRFFGIIQQACQYLAATEKIWLETQRQQLARRQRRKGATHSVQFSEVLVRVKRMQPPFLKTNLDIWGLNAGDVQIYFFPDYLFVFRGGYYNTASYSSLDIRFETELINVQGEIPKDAQLADGTPAHRKPRNRVKQARYGLVRLVSTVGFSLRLHASNHTLSQKFAELFQTAQGSLAQRKPAEPKASQPPKSQPVPTQPRKPAHEVLGIHPDANLDEIKAAYHRVAKMNHPDRVADMAPEFKELATRQIREINAAYDELRKRAIAHQEVAPNSVDLG